MIYFPVRNVFVEGPDCSGKTTLINSIHKETHYKWHLFDRSQISRGIFASMYDRKLPFASLHEREEINDLNNLYIFLVPDWMTIKTRFLLRGDDIHDIHSLRRVYDLFETKLGSVKEHPNIKDFSGIPPDDLPAFAIDAIENLEKMSLDEISSYVYLFCQAQPGGEAISLSFSLVDDGNFECASSSILDHEGESEYYRRIRSKMLDKIVSEFAGENEYKKPQNIFSRRFIHTENTCISMIHALYRENVLEVNFNVRSTNVEKTFPYDLKFAYFLSSEIYKQLGLVPGTNACVVRFILNSAHIVW